MTVTTALLTVVEMTVMVSTVFHPCIQVLTCSYIHTVITFIHTFLPQIHTHNTHTHSLLFPPDFGGNQEDRSLGSTSRDTDSGDLNPAGGDKDDGKHV